MINKSSYILDVEKRARKSCLMNVKMSAPQHIVQHIYGCASLCDCVCVCVCVCRVEVVAVASEVGVWCYLASPSRVVSIPIYQY